MASLEETADELAQLALADEARTGDDQVIKDVSNILGSSSQTLQEAFDTAIRVRRAEARARKLLKDRMEAAKSAPPAAG